MAQLQNTDITGSLKVIPSGSGGGQISASANIIAGGDLAVNGGDITSVASSFNLINTNAKTINFGQAADRFNLGSSVGSGELYLSGTSQTMSVMLINHLNSFRSGQSLGGYGVYGKGGASISDRFLRGAVITAYDDDSGSGKIQLFGGLSANPATTELASFGVVTGIKLNKSTNIIGNLQVQGTISSSGNITTAGNLTVNGTLNATTNTATFTNLTASSLLVNNNLTVNGNTTLGNASTDIIDCIGQIQTTTARISSLVTSLETNDRIRIGNNSSPAIMTILTVIPEGTGSAAARVGINNETPRSKLHIKQSSQSVYGGFRTSRSDNNNNWGIFTGGTNTDLIFSYGTAADGSGHVNKAWIVNNPLIVGSLNFTGQHRNKPNNNLNENSAGLIVVSDGIYQNIGGYISININEALPTVSLSNSRNQKNVFGVISNLEDYNSNTRTYEHGAFVTAFEKQSDDNRLIINSLGEGAVWVCNINGNLENGDYITTCEIPGYGMKQDDDLLHNYTVAKITCDCDFDLNSPIYMCEEFEFSGSTYRKAFVGCTYHCG